MVQASPEVLFLVWFGLVLYIPINSYGYEGHPIKNETLSIAQ